ncbi:hypothetical protein BJV74DRAFT_895167 [Russula compacta]|nr:hypothetical protein BJV74DRAFT_895167 [Russula compacta]
MEIDWFWCAGPHTWASAIYMVNRYIAVLGHIPFFFLVYGDPCKTEHTSVNFDRSDCSPKSGSPCYAKVLLAMRVYCLYLRNKWVLSLVALEFTAGVVVACWVIVTVTPSTGTLEHAHSRRTLHEVVKYATAVSEVPLADYSGSVIWNCNLVNIILLSLPKPLLEYSTVDFTNILSVVMVSRLMINLRDPTLQKQVDYDETVATSHVGYISTFVDDALSPMAMATTQTQTELNQSSYAA